MKPVKFQSVSYISILIFKTNSQIYAILSSCHRLWQSLLINLAHAWWHNTVTFNFIGETFLPLVFHLDSTIPSLFVISLSFSKFLFFIFYFLGAWCSRSMRVCQICGEVFHNFRDPITQRYESFPFFFVHGLLWNCLKFGMYFM